MPRGGHGCGGRRKSSLKVLRPRHAIEKYLIFKVLLLGSVLLLSCASPTELKTDDDALEKLSTDKQRYPTRPAWYWNATEGDEWPHRTASRWPAGPIDDIPGLETNTNGKKHEHERDQSKELREDDKAEVSVNVRQVKSSSSGTRWVELRVEVRGPDGKINTGYTGGIAASLISADVEESPDSSEAKAVPTGRAVEMASNVAVQGTLHSTLTRCVGANATPRIISNSTFGPPGNQVA